VVKGTPSHIYVVNPAVGSLHSYGFAIDLSFNNQSGKEINMGAPFDYFGKKGEPRHEDEELRSGALSREQYQNRRLLRSILEEAGFHSISTEWWHFDALPGAQVRGHYPPIE
jgi:D-alanyl-D-alanine dipeptidase